MILQIPAINGLGITNGCELAPKKICDLLKLKSETILINKNDLDEQELTIYSEVMRRLNLGEQLTILGGDHSISFPIGKAFLDTTKNPRILIFDAHLDMMEPLKNPTHEEWLRALIEHKSFKDILVVGIRRKSKNIDEREVEYARDKSIKLVYSDEFEEKKNEIIDFCKGKEIYISLDVDVFDKSLVDSTGYPEMNGLREDLIPFIKSIKNVKVLDLVEVNTTKGSFNKTLPLIKELLWKK